MIVNKTIAAAMAAAACCLAAPLAAQTVEAKRIEEKHLESGKHELDPGKGYLYASGSTRTNALFIKTPDADEIAAYEAEWVEEFEKAKKRYPGRLKRWQTLVDQRRNAGDKPVEPTEANFSIEPLEVRMFASYGPMNVYSKGKDEDGSKFFDYLTELEPGTYTYYGPIFRQPNGQAFGTCYCMGSVKFEVKAGEITSIGNLLAEGWVTPEARRMANVQWRDLPEREVEPIDWSVPASLNGLPVVQADLRASGKRNNVLNLMVGRMPPVAGVLAYERDIPIDVKGLAEQEAAVAAVAVEEAAADVEAASDAVEAATVESADDAG